MCPTLHALQDTYSHQSSISTPATLLADAFDIPSDTFGIPMDQSPLLTPVDMEGMSVNIPVDAFGIPEDVLLNSLDMDVDACSIPAEQLALAPAAMSSVIHWMPSVCWLIMTKHQ